MADLEKIKETIRELAGRRKNVALAEIERVVNQLQGRGYDTASRSARHGKLYRVGQYKFMICYHNPGEKQLKGCYVDAFIDAMIELGLYEE